MSCSHDLAIGHINERLTKLEKQRNRLARTVMAMSVVLLVLIGGIFLFLQERNDARAYYNEQLRNLACLAVKRIPSAGSPTIRDLRDKYECPPYRAPAPAKRHTPKATGPAVTLPLLSPRPFTLPTRATVPPAPRTSPPGLSSTPHPSSTPAPSPTPTRISTPTAPHTTPNPIGRLVCRVLGIVVPCRTEPLP